VRIERRTPGSVRGIRKPAAVNPLAGAGCLLYPCQPPCWSPFGRIAVAGRGIEDMTRKCPKTEFVGIRMSLVDVGALRAEAGQRGTTMSELVRRRIAGQAVTSRTDQETAANIDRLGRMLKFLYPKDKGWATSEDRKRWWATVTELERTAKALYR